MRPRPSTAGARSARHGAAQTAEAVTVAACEKPVAKDTAQPVPSAVGPSETGKP